MLNLVYLQSRLLESGCRLEHVTFLDFPTTIDLASHKEGLPHCASFNQTPSTFGVLDALHSIASEVFGYLCLTVTWELTYQSLS